MMVGIVGGISGDELVTQGDALTQGRKRGWVIGLFFLRASEEVQPVYQFVFMAVLFRVGFHQGPRDLDFLSISYTSARTVTSACFPPACSGAM